MARILDIDWVFVVAGLILTLFLGPLASKIELALWHRKQEREEQEKRLRQMEEKLSEIECALSFTEQERDQQEKRFME